MSKPTKTGIDMGKVAFSVNGKSYTTTRLSSTDVATLNVAQAAALVGTAGTSEVPYLSQFPWVTP